MLGDVLGLNKSVVEATKQVEVPDDEVELVDDDVLAGSRMTARPKDCWAIRWS